EGSVHVPVELRPQLLPLSRRLRRHLVRARAAVGAGSAFTGAVESRAVQGFRQDLDDAACGVVLGLSRHGGHAGLEQRSAAPRCACRPQHGRPRGTAAAAGQRKGTMMSSPDTCDWADVQGLVRSGYKRLPHAMYLLFRVADVVWARGFLASLLPDIPAAAVKPDERALHIALSCDGIRVLGGLDDAQMSSFPYAFLEGMTGTRHRSRVLG